MEDPDNLDAQGFRFSVGMCVRYEGRKLLKPLMKGFPGRVSWNVCSLCRKETAETLNVGALLWFRGTYKRVEN